MGHRFSQRNRAGGPRNQGSSDCYGRDWLKELNNRVDGPKVDFVRREVSIALERRALGEVEIFPILVGGAKIPAFDELHPELKDDIGKLLDYHAHEFPPDIKLWDTQFERLRECLANVEGIQCPRAQTPKGDNGEFFPKDDIEPALQASFLNLNAVQEAFGTISSALLSWPQEIERQWIERPELDRLHKLTTRNESTYTVLLGGPGEGKSAILARLGKNLTKEGTVLLAIKADQLPKSTATLQDLEDWIGSDVPATQALRQLANDHRVVVLIDQLDALSELMDQHSERLGSLIWFINSIRDFPNLHIIVSCREFEFRNDLRFKALKAEEVSLQPLSWEQVKPFLSARGFRTSGWSKDVRNVLRTPQHLAMFLGHVKISDHTPNFTNYQDLLARIIDKRLEQVHGPQTVKAAERIATEMAKEEELWLGRDRFEFEFDRELDRLEEAGFLIRSENGQSIAFRHQTLFDFLRSRAFLRNRQSLARFVVDQKQQSLFVRPILWSTLNYLRSSDRAGYRKQFHALRSRQDLRPHIQSLIVRFLGQLRDPDDREAPWLMPLLDDHELRPSVLLAIAGSPGWFARLKSRLPTFMTVEPEMASEVTTVLGSASSFEPGSVLRAIDRYWVPDERYHPYAQNVMLDFSSWDESRVETVYKLADSAPADTFWIQRIAGRISKCRPDLAPKVLSRYLKTSIEKLDSSRSKIDRQPASETLDDAPAEASLISFVEMRHYERLIDSIDWDGIDEVARRAPRAFIEELWSCLNQLFSRLALKEHSLLFRYRNHRGRGFKRESKEKPPLESAIQISMRGFAESHAEEYLAFVEKNKDTDLLILHRLFSVGMKEIAPHHPSAVLNYLLEDPRRFALGDNHDELGDTQELISAVVSSLEKDEVLSLESAIRQWTWYRRAPEHEVFAERIRRFKWIVHAD